MSKSRRSLNYFLGYFFAGITFIPYSEDIHNLKKANVTIWSRDERIEKNILHSSKGKFSELSSSFQPNRNMNASQAALTIRNWLSNKGIEANSTITMPGISSPSLFPYFSLDNDNGYVSIVDAKNYVFIVFPVEWLLKYFSWTKERYDQFLSVLNLRITDDDDDKVKVFFGELLAEIESVVPGWRIRTIGTTSTTISIVLEKGSSASPSTVSNPISSKGRNYQQINPKKDDNSFLAGVERNLMLEIQSFGTSTERLMATTPDGHTIPTNGIILNTMPKKGRMILTQVQAHLANSQYRAYLLAESFSQNLPDKIAILKSDDEFYYLSVVQTNGNNYGISHSQVVERYRQWKEKYGLILIGAGNDWLDAKFRNPPDDWLAFAREVYEFCPDVVNQGTESIDSLAEEMRRSNSVYLWWD